MSTKKLEELVLLLVVALLIQFVGAQAVTSYIASLTQDIATDAERSVAFAESLEYSTYAHRFLSALTNLVIGYWLYSSVVTKKFMWLLLGVFASWWSLPIFVYHAYVKANEQNS